MDIEFETYAIRKQNKCLRHKCSKINIAKTVMNGSGPVSLIINHKEIFRYMARKYMEETHQ